MNNIKFRLIFLPYFLIAWILQPNLCIGQTILNCNLDEEILDCSHWRNMNFVFTQKNIYLIKNEKKLKCKPNNELVLHGATTNDYIWIISSNGLAKAKLENGNFGDFKRVELPILDYSTMNFHPDPVHHDLVWIFSRNDGIYTVSDDGQIKLIMNVSMLNDISIVSTSDYWMGTDVGLIHRVNGVTYKYNEEGVAGFEVPDNIVDKLYSNGKQLLVQMSEPLCLFNLEGENTESHGETIDFIGEKGNAIYDAHFLKNGSVLFATKEDLIYVSKDYLTKGNASNANHEVFETTNRAGAHVIDKSKLKNSKLIEDGGIRKIFSYDQNKIWLISNHIIYQLPIKILVK